MYRKKVGDVIWFRDAVVLFGAPDEKFPEMCHGIAMAVMLLEALGI